MIAIGGGQNETAGAGVGDEGDAVFFIELFDEQAQAFFDQREFVRLVHGAGDIDEEDEVAVALFETDFFALDADAGEAVLRLPGAIGDFDVDGEGMRGVEGGAFEVVGEVVDEFLDAHGVARRQGTAVEEAAGVGVGGGVHIDGEGGQGLAEDGGEGVFLDGGVGFVGGGVLAGVGGTVKDSGFVKIDVSVSEFSAAGEGVGGWGTR